MHARDESSPITEVSAEARRDATIIAFASPKGGGGKTTLAILLASEFAHGGWSGSGAG